MKFLLDTHIFLWFISGDKRLPKFARNKIQEFENEVYLSVISLWEAIIKYQIGKLPLPKPPNIYLPKQRARHFISSLELDEASIIKLAKLPLIHRDPFDRILICQALTHEMTIITSDEHIRSYNVSVLNF
ncbi:type II toxin-antitoxin system VapC family toxin [candidate division KSB1 bacterium]|nr:type II toxin-antitoxin system VapC family toxin [candidate division KSB1 bacterium]